MICKHCGTEFEGNFCPNCGTRAQTEETACPVCGAPHKAGERFCSGCGYQFEQPVQQPAVSQPYENYAAPYSGSAAPSAPPAGDAASQPAPLQAGGKPDASAAPASAGGAKAYAVLRYAGAALFALYTLLLFVFYTAPLAVMSGFGESMGMASVWDYNNEMTGYAEVPSLQNACLTLIIFAVLMLIAAAVLLAVTIPAKAKGKKVRLFGKETGFDWLVTGITCVLYLVMLIVACVAMGAVSSEDQGMGMLKAGGAPVLTLVFAILFALFAVGAQIARMMIAKKYPAVSEAENAVGEKARAAVQANAKAGAADASAAASEQGGGASAPVSAEYQPGDAPAQYEEVNALVRFKRGLLFVLFGLMLPVALGAIIGATAISSLDMSLRFFVCFVVAWWVVAIVGQILFSRRPKHKFNDAQMRGALHGGLWSFGYIVLCYALFIASVIVLVDQANSGLGSTGGSIESLVSIVVYTIPTAVLSTASFILTFVSSIGVSMKRRDAREAFYGTSRPRIKQAPAISFEEYEKRSRAYVAALDAERKPSPKARNAIKGVSFGVVLLAAVITVIVVLSSYAGSAFNISKIKEIARGDSRDEVIELLGEPYGYDKDPNASVFVYYSENYASLLRRAEELGEDVDSFDDLENALEEAAKLEEQMWDMQYQVITVTFGADGVESVSYDAAHINSDVDPSKSYSTKTLLDENMNEIGSIEQFAETDLYYSVEYYDGSYYFGLLERGFVATVTGEENVEGYDPYGNNIYFYVSVIPGSEYAVSSIEDLLTNYKSTVDAFLEAEVFEKLIDECYGRLYTENVTAAVFDWSVDEYDPQQIEEISLRFIYTYQGTRTLYEAYASPSDLTLGDIVIYDRDPEPARAAMEDAYCYERDSIRMEEAPVRGDSGYIATVALREMLAEIADAQAAQDALEVVVEKVGRTSYPFVDGTFQANEYQITFLMEDFSYRTYSMYVRANQSDGENAVLTRLQDGVENTDYVVEDMQSHSFDPFENAYPYITYQAQ